MRIAIDGVQSTGKTTLFEALRKRNITGLSCIPEAARVTAPSMGITSPETWNRVLTNRDLTLEFFSRLKRWQEEQERSAESFIVDSSFFIHQAYKEYFGVSGIDFLDRTYDLILFLPTIGMPFREDGFRFSTGREEVEQLYLTIINSSHSGEFVKLPFGRDRFFAAEREILARLRRE